MATTTETRTRTAATTAADWRAGVVAGIAGAAVMAVLISVMNAATLTVAIPSLYTLAPPANGVVGWVVHLSHGAVLGVVFAGLLGATGLADADVSRTTVAGVGYGVVTWALLAALLMPLWLSAVGSPASPPFPNFALPSLLWHVVYGLVLGAGYAASRDRL